MIFAVIQCAISVDEHGLYNRTLGCLDLIGIALLSPSGFKILYKSVFSIFLKSVPFLRRQVLIAFILGPGFIGILHLKEDLRHFVHVVEAVYSLCLGKAAGIVKVHKEALLITCYHLIAEPSAVQSVLVDLVELLHLVRLPVYEGCIGAASKEAGSLCGKLHSRDRTLKDISEHLHALFITLIST